MDFSNYYFEPVNVTDSTVTMRLTAQDGATIDIDYKLLKDNYLLNFDVKSQGMQKHLPSSLNSIQLAWQTVFLNTKKVSILRTCIRR